MIIDPVVGKEYRKVVKNGWENTVARNGENIRLYDFFDLFLYGGWYALKGVSGIAEENCP
jgi:hypothetical protein